MKLHIDFVTRSSQIDETTGSIVDHVCIDTPEILQSISHLPVWERVAMTLSHNQTSFSKPRSHVSWVHRLNIDDLLQTLKDTPLDRCFADLPDVDCAWNNLQDLFLAVVNDVVPRAMPKKSRRAPWMISNKILRVIKKKHKLYPTLRMDVMSLHILCEAGLKHAYCCQFTGK